MNELIQSGFIEPLCDILDEIAASVYLKDINGKYIACNKYMLVMIGETDRKNVIGKTDRDLVWKDIAADLEKVDQLVMKNKTKYEVEETPLIASGSHRIYLTTKTPLYDSKRNVVGLIGVSVDITDRKKMEEELKIAKEKAEEANKLKTQFIQNMEHDIRTPASGVYSVIHNLAIAEQEPSKKETLELLSNSSEKLLNLLNDILNFSQTESGQMPVLDKKFDVKQMVSDLVAMQAPAVISKKLALTFDCAPNVPAIIISDESRIYRILLNLIGNAIKFTKKGFVKVSLSVAKKVDNRNIILKLIVADSGIGIPKDKQFAVYERFNRGTASNRGIYAGMGLGLTIVKQFVDELEGEIDLVSAVDRGTTFTCLLPVKLPLIGEEDKQQQEATMQPYETQAKPAKKQSTKKITQPLKILLVEDDPLQLQGITGELKVTCPNAQLDIATTGNLAIDKATQNDYEIIFMDVGLPDIAGTEVTKKIRKLKTNVPIVALTSNANSATKNECMQSGMNDFLDKPLTEKKIRDVIRLWVGKQDDRSRRNFTVSDLESCTKPLGNKANEIIDWEEIIAALGKEQAMNLLDKFVKELADTQREIEKEMTSGNFEKIAFLAHRLKGGAAICRAEKLDTILGDLETAAKNKQQKDVKKIFNKVKLAVHEVAENFLKRDE